MGLRSGRLRHQLAVTKTIAHAADRFDHVGPLAQLAAEGPNVNVDRPLHDHRVFAQGSVDQLGAVKDAARLPNQRVKEAEFTPRQRELAALGYLLTPAAIDGDAKPGRD